MFESVGYVAMRSALDALALRQRVIADNVANIQTPGFLSGRVSFEKELASAYESGTPSSAHVNVARSLEPTREDGNNVNLETETLSNIDTVLRFQLATQEVGRTYTDVRAALRLQ